MRRQRIARLNYRFEHHFDITYRAAEPVVWEENGFRAELRDGHLSVDLRADWIDVKDARAAVEPYLRTWEIAVGVRGKRETVQFVFENADVVDFGPTPYLETEFTEVSVTSWPASIHSTRSKYPDPPKAFWASPDVRTLWDRYQGALEGQEPFLSMAYFNYTLIVHRAGSRDEAARVLNVDQAVLRKLGELTSERGDRSTARKAPRNQVFVQLTDQERRWIDAAIRALIHRVAEVDAGAAINRLRMADLPPAG